MRPYDSETDKVGPSTMVTTEPGASDAIWSHDGSTIYYVDRHDHLQAMTMTTEPELTLSDPRTVLDVDELNAVGDSLVPLPDGERFVFIQRDEQERDAEHLNVVLNWFEELKKKVPVQVTKSD